MNAEIYREFVEHFPVYRVLNRRLVELARIREAHRVLDLGCGTGATTTACLRELPPDGEVEGIDASETMIQAARGTVCDPRARFRKGSASTLGEVVRGSFDRALSNAAFWLFLDSDSVLRALSDVLKPGGLFVFNAPIEAFTHQRTDPEPFQISLAQEVSERTGSPPLPPRLLDMEELEGSLARNGFHQRARHDFNYRGRQGELMALMEVPALARQLAPQLGYAECLDIVRQAAARNDPLREVDVPWAYFVATWSEN